MTAAPCAAIPNFTAGYAPAPSDFNGWVQAPFAFLTARTNVRVWQTGSGQTLTSGGYTVLALNTVLEDPYSGWSATATSSQAANSWLAPYDGWYDVTVTVAVASAAVHLEPALLLSGVTQYEVSAASTPSGQDGLVCATIRVPMIGGLDYIQPEAWCSAAVTTSTALGRNCALEITWATN
jgi:hypothetical protein